MLVNVFLTYSHMNSLELLHLGRHWALLESDVVAYQHFVLCVNAEDQRETKANKQHLELLTEQEVNF